MASIFQKHNLRAWTSSQGKLFRTAPWIWAADHLRYGCVAKYIGGDLAPTLGGDGNFQRTSF